ncbi:MAG: 3-hydroxyacyl-CoA dehydrogenase family protein [Deltaproteobacteria bacterium]|nr:3-hydroxyacyl-CoA dehydrogenase family protein [Deltaproteobacteria bacterium]
MKIPRIKRVAIVGAGTMGPRIAYRCIVSGLECRLQDISPPALDGARTKIDRWLAELIEPDQAKESRERLKITASLEDCLAGADLVIETVPENLEIKRRMFAELDRLAPAEALLATNSSSIPCSRLADATSRPEKIFNINFADPTHDLEVEIMKGAGTADSTIIAGERFCRSLGMVPIVTLKQIMGFSFNRIWRAVKREALHLVDEGYSDFQDIDRAWMLCFGTPHGPFGFMDVIGLDVVRDIEEQYYLDSSQERDRPPRLLDDMISQGRLGVKSGRGFYTYPEPDFKNPDWLHKRPPFESDLAAKLNFEED